MPIQFEIVDDTKPEPFSNSFVRQEIQRIETNKHQELQEHQQASEPASDLVSISKEHNTQASKPAIQSQCAYTDIEHEQNVVDGVDDHDNGFNDHEQATTNNNDDDEPRRQESPSGTAHVFMCVHAPGRNQLGVPVADDDSGVVSTEGCGSILAQDACQSSLPQSCGAEQLTLAAHCLASTASRPGRFISGTPNSNIPDHLPTRQATGLCKTSPTGKEEDDEKRSDNMIIEPNHTTAHVASTISSTSTSSDGSGTMMDLVDTSLTMELGDTPLTDGSGTVMDLADTTLTTELVSADLITGDGIQAILDEFRLSWNYDPLTLPRTESGEVSVHPTDEPGEGETLSKAATPVQGEPHLDSSNGELHFQSLEDMLDFAREAQARVGTGTDMPDAPPGLGQFRDIDVEKSLSTQHITEIDEAVKDKRISKRQGKTLKRTISRLKTECMAAYVDGEDMEVWMRRIQIETAAEDDGFTAIDVFNGAPWRQAKSPIDPALIGDPGQKWLRIRNGITMDSGCSVFVVPSDWLCMFAMEESEGSRRGQQYTAAAKDGKPILNEGQKTIRFVTKDGQKKKVLCQVAKVNKILASIAGICDNNNHVLFRADGGDIIHLADNKKTPFRRNGNIYVLDAWVLNPHWQGETDNAMDTDETMMGFSRQDKS